MNENDRRATNEALFRDVNERIAESADGVGAGKTAFVCECSDPTCTERVPVTLAEYERVRARPTTFLLAPGHDQPDIERVVSERRGLHVVEKVQAAVRQTVIRLDPRRRSAPADG